jgi:hypothetical protein
VIIVIALVAPWWIASYVVAGWTGIAVMAVVATAGEVVLFAADELRARQQRKWLGALDQTSRVQATGFRSTGDRAHDLAGMLRLLERPAFREERAGPEAHL